MKYLVRQLEIIEGGERKILPLHYIILDATTGNIGTLPLIYPFGKEESGAIFIGKARLIISGESWAFSDQVV